MPDPSRPSKRQKLAHTLPLKSPKSPKKPTQKTQTQTQLRPLPPPILLLSLPALIIQPPTSRFHGQSLCLSLAAVRACLGLQLSPEEECRAWTALAEVGMGVVAGGLAGERWAVGVESEVEKAIAKGTLIAQKHPSLTTYLHHLTFLHARLASWHQNPKFARKLLARLSSSFLPTDPPHIVYAAHLARIESFLSSSPPSSSPSASPTPNASDVHAALGNIDTLQALAEDHAHARVVLLCKAIRLRALVAAERWEDVGDALASLDAALGMEFDAAEIPPPGSPTKSKSKPQAPGSPKKPQTQLAQQPPCPEFTHPFETAMALHALVLGITYMTHKGEAGEASARLGVLHRMLDGGAGERVSMGVVEIPFANGPPLRVQVTHPRVVYMLTFLVSAVAKRDVVGRKPKRKVFAGEGVAAWTREAGKEVTLLPWTSVGDVEEVQERMARIKADLLCELVAVGVMRSEFDDAQKNLDELIAHTRTYDIFDLFAARVALHQGHLAHAQGDADRAVRCYQAAAWLAGGSEEGRRKDEFVEIAARAGELMLRIGMHGREEGVRGGEGERLVKRCKGRGATLEAVAQVIEACLATEILKSKQHLKQALSLASRAQDNYLRALLLALISAHYLHTAPEHAGSMLEACEQLAMGLGAPMQKLGGVGVGGRMGKTRVEVVPAGNEPLRRWCGERRAEVGRREKTGGKEAGRGK